MAIDYGQKRCGIAVSDPLKIIATGLTTVLTHDLPKWMSNYIQANEVEKLVIGLPLTLGGDVNEVERFILEFIAFMTKNHSSIPIIRLDERFTSKLAANAILNSGIKKKDRKDKSLVDQVSATILLQNYMYSL
ncbi:MAG: Holliday junction resolvase RuvX [Bacteroidota bacterium]|nr:Holliday junction resolvase RuvX [Bacteroidota bacterium]